MSRDADALTAALADSQRFAALRAELCHRAEAYLRPPASPSLARIRFTVLRLLQAHRLPVDRAHIAQAADRLAAARQIDAHAICGVTLHAARLAGADLAAFEAANQRQLTKKG
jgi:hypothetical protein